MPTIYLTDPTSHDVISWLKASAKKNIKLISSTFEVSHGMGWLKEGEKTNMANMSFAELVFQFRGLVLSPGPPPLLNDCKTWARDNKESGFSREGTTTIHQRTTAAANIPAKDWTLDVSQLERVWLNA